jgi:hypothetical protein
MTIKEFTVLDFEDQIDTAWNSVFLDVIAVGGHNNLLFDMGGFYVELYYGPSINEIIGLKPFKATDHLMPYLDQITIGELAN